MKEAQLINLKPGQVVAVGGKLYGRCAGCGEIVCINKWLLGSLHLCAAEEAERKRDDGRE